MRGLGLSSCADLVSRHNKDKQFTEMLYGTWMVGFISGINMQRVADDKPRHLMPEPLKVFESVKQRCESKSDEPVLSDCCGLCHDAPHRRSQNRPLDRTPSTT